MTKPTVSTGTDTKLKPRKKRKTKAKEWQQPTTKRSGGYMFDAVNRKSNARWNRKRKMVRASVRDRHVKYEDGHRMQLIAGHRMLPDPTSDERPRPLVRTAVLRTPTKPDPLVVRANNRKRNRQARRSRKLNR